MRRLPVILLTFIAALSVTSCRKTYLCECRNDQYANYQYVNQSTYTTDIKSPSRSKAEKVCINMNNEDADENGYGAMIICDLK